MRAFSSAGGTILAGCSGSDAYLASWLAAAGYRVKWVTPGPAGQAAATFKAESTEITMTVTCTSGEPIVSTSSKFSIAGVDLGGLEVHYGSAIALATVIRAWSLDTDTPAVDLIDAHIR